MSNVMTLQGRFNNVHISTNELNQIRQGDRSQLSKIWDKIVDWFCGTQKVKAKQLLEKFCSDRIPHAERISSFQELKNLAAEGYKCNFHEKSFKDYDSYELYDDNDVCLLIFTTTLFTQMEKRIYDEIEYQLRINKEYPESNSVFYKDCSRYGGEDKFKVNDKILISKNTKGKDIEKIVRKDIEKMVQGEGLKVIYGICHQGFHPLLTEDIVTIPGNDKEIPFNRQFNIITDENKKLLKIRSLIHGGAVNKSSDVYKMLRRMDDENNRSGDNRPAPFGYSLEYAPFGYSLKLDVALKVQYSHNDSLSSVIIEKIKCSYTKFADDTDLVLSYDRSDCGQRHLV